MNNIEYMQQGDVLFFKIESIVRSAIQIKGNIVQEGEATGHAHRLYDGEFQLFETPKKEKYLRVVTPTMLRHEEHKAFEIPPGEYRIGIVKEYDPFEQEMRNVVD